MQGSTSKLRNVYGDASKERFEDVRPNETTTEGSLIDANSHFIAVSWASSGGGCVAVFDSNNFTRLRNDMPLIRGHTGPVTDVKFSPFRPNLLLTGSEDSTIRVWDIPQEGIQEGLTEQQKYTGHAKKIGMMAFHPTVAEVVASSSFDNTIQVWNICNGTTYAKQTVGDTVTSLDWNHNGSLLGYTTKQKVVNVFDPRTNTVTLNSPAHESGKTQKMLFLDSNYLFTCGFSRGNERQIKLFDMRNFSAPAQTVHVDGQSGIMMPFFDADSGLIYLPGRGEGNVKYYDYSSSTIKFANEYRSTNPQKGMSFFAKRTMNYNKCEIARFAKLTNNTIEYLSFYFPKRNEGYDSNVYPECLSGEPALGVEEWLKGENKEPIRKNITTLENKWSTSEMTFEKKVEVVEEKKTSENDIEAKLAALEKVIKDQQDKINSLQTENRSLKEELESSNIRVEELSNLLNKQQINSEVEQAPQEDSQA